MRKAYAALSMLLGAALTFPTAVRAGDDSVTPTGVWNPLSETMLQLFNIQNGSLVICELAVIPGVGCFNGDISDVVDFGSNADGSPFATMTSDPGTDDPLDSEVLGPIDFGHVIYMDELSINQAPYRPLRHGDTLDPGFTFVVLSAPTLTDYIITSDFSTFDPPELPEPATLLLLASGLAGMAAVGRQRKRRAA